MIKNSTRRSMIANRPMPFHDMPMFIAISGKWASIIQNTRRGLINLYKTWKKGDSGILLPGEYQCPAIPDHLKFSGDCIDKKFLMLTATNWAIINGRVAKNFLYKAMVIPDDYSKTLELKKDPIKKQMFCEHCRTDTYGAPPLSLTSSGLSCPECRRTYDV